MTYSLNISKSIWMDTIYIVNIKVIIFSKLKKDGSGRVKNDFYSAYVSKVERKTISLGVRDYTK